MQKLFVLPVLVLAVSAADAQQIEARPGPEVLEGEPLQLAVAGLKPGTEITLRASRLHRGKPFQSEARFVADARGRVDLGAQAPLAGSYSGIDGRGLFWAMAPVGPERVPRFDGTVGEVIVQAFADARPLAEQRIVLRPAAPDVQVRVLDEFPGARFAMQPALPGAKRPAIIALGGSEGGSSAARTTAPELASQGFAVLGLPYYSPPSWTAEGPKPPELQDLPASFVDIELTRLEQARDWLARQPGVDATRIAVYGVSKGAEFALAAASRMPWIRGVVAIVPSDVIWEGWGPDAPVPGQRSSFSWKGQALPFLPYLDFDAEFAGAAQGRDIVIRRPLDKGRAAHPGRIAAARIEVEKIAAPVLLVAGSDDQVWDSAGMAQAIDARRRAAGLPTEALIYEGAGHALSPSGWTPTTQYNVGPVKFGGTPALDARAQADAWPRTIAFLRRALN